MRSNPNKLFVLQSVVSKASHKVRRSVGSQRKAYNKRVDYDNWKLIGNTIHNLITSLPNHKKVQHFSEKYFIQIIANHVNSLKENFYLSNRNLRRRVSFRRNHITPTKTSIQLQKPHTTIRNMNSLVRIPKIRDIHQ